MKLVNAHIRNYRSIEDSDEFAVEPDVTCLVGKNESGKTASLRALFRTNPIEPTTFEEVIDFPARLSRRRRELPEGELIPAVTAEFELDDTEAAIIARHFGPDALRSRQVVVTKGYRNPGGTAAYDFDEQAIRRHLRDQLDLNTAHAEQVAAATDIEELTHVLEALQDRPQAAIELQQQLDAWGGTGWACIHSLLDPHLPKFVYFDDYDVMPGKVSIPDMIHRRDADTLERARSPSSAS